VTNLSLVFNVLRFIGFADQTIVTKSPLIFESLT
jgi:hypothetical protein